MKEDKEPSDFQKWFDKAQTSYTEWEDSLWDNLGAFGAWMKKKRSKKVPDWKRVQEIWIWISILAFFVGWSIAGMYYQVECNTHIVEEFYPEEACRLGLKCNMTGDFLSDGNVTLSLLSGDKEVDYNEFGKS